MPKGRKHDSGDWFPTTQWSLVVAAGRRDEGREALSTLCGVYWPPVYSYVRRRGHDAESSRDLVQGFFTQLLEQHAIRHASRERGRFRSFLLTSVKNYLANEWDRTRARKRGGGAEMFSLDLDDAEASHRLDPGHDETPERLFERHWARTLLDRVLLRLELEMDRAGKAERFRRFRPYLIGDEDPPGYRELARLLDTSEAAVKVAVHRLRKRFGGLLREEVARTVQDESKIDEEIQYLFNVIDPGS